jgi:hypothetical protein
MSISRGANPHHQHMEINSHGYGLIEIFRDSIVATPYYSDILTTTNIETAGQRMLMKNGENHWERIISSINQAEDAVNVAVYPNPASDIIFLKLPELNGSTIQLNIFNSLGQLIIKQELSHSTDLSIDALQSGMYWLSFEQKGKKSFTTKLNVIK